MTGERGSGRLWTPASAPIACISLRLPLTLGSFGGDFASKTGHFPSLQASDGIQTSGDKFSCACPGQLALSSSR